MTAFIVELDTDKDGTFDAAVDNITQYVIDIRIASGFNNEMAHTANIGQCFLVVNNEDRRFSPLYASGPLFGKITYYLPLRVRTATHTLFRGYVKSVDPDAGTLGLGRCLILAEDALSIFERETIEIPPLEDIRSDTLAKIVAADVFQGGVAEGTFRLYGSPNNDEHFEINGITYHLIAPRTVIYDIGGDTADVVARALSAAVNASQEDTDLYFPGTPKHPDVTAKTTLSFLSGIAFSTASIGWTFSDFAMSYQGDDRVISEIGLPLAKTGSPGDITVRVVADHTSNTLVDPNAIGTITAGDIVAGIEYVQFAGEFTIHTGDFVKLSYGAETGPGAYYTWSTIETPPSAELPAYQKTYSTGEWEDSTWIFSLHLPAIVTISAPARGTYANGFTLSTDATNVVVSGATLAGGTDGSNAISAETGESTFKLVGTTWDKGVTNGWQALDDVARSEFGYTWIARDGTLTFKNKSWEFTRFLATPTLTIAGQHQEQPGSLDEKRVINAATVSHVPADQTETGVVAMASAPIAVPGGSFTGAGEWPRYNLLSAAPGAGDKIVNLPFVSSEGVRVGARDVGVPVATTDYTVNDKADGTGFNYTSTGRIAISIAPSGSSIEISFRNDATGVLYVRGLQARGTLIKQYSPESFTAENAVSIAAYGRKHTQFDLALDSGAVLAEAIPYYLIYRYADPGYVVDAIVFKGTESVGGVSILTVEIGDVLSLTEYQTAVAAQLYLVRGVQYDIRDGGNVTDVIFAVKRLDQQQFIIFDDPVYGQFDGSAVFAL